MISFRDFISTLTEQTGVSLVERVMNFFGIHSEFWISLTQTAVTLLIVALLGWIAYIIAKKWLAKLVMKIAGKTEAKWDDLLFDQRFFNRLGQLIAAIVIAIALSTIEAKSMLVINKFLYSWIVIASMFLVSSVLDGGVRIYNTYEFSKDRPISVFVQVIKIFLWCAVLLILVSIFTGKSVMALLAGLAAATAVLMLIFQDSILGFVAGIQLSANNMVRVGDWIVMPGRNLDGDVLEINLTTVKVQNFDKTITTVPTHKLVTESFTNWRGMQDSGGRRIKRSVNIDVNSIRELNEEDIERLRNSDLLRDYMKDKKNEITEFNIERDELDRRRLTNIGTFRRYFQSWLRNNPNINQEMNCMVRQLQPGPTGLPLEVYCFTATTAWLVYEDIQSDVFDHLYSVLELFGLEAFQYSGTIAEK